MVGRAVGDELVAGSAIALAANLELHSLLAPPVAGCRHGQGLYSRTRPTI